jgi:eukaryotic-like serine/threonine-protein kinase
VVHRDVSPQNVLISSKGIVKVIDFGVVKARRRLTEETSTGTIKGKLQYMAPEQALGHAVDRRADIWAVGATLYRLLARRPVYPGGSPLSTFNRLTSSVAPEPLPAHVPVALSSIVLKALAFEPERRFNTAAELGAALEALLYGPYQTTAREVAATVEQYLGASLSARRAAIIEALGGQRPSPVGGYPMGGDWESGVSQAERLPEAPSSAPPSQSPTVVDALPLREALGDDVTRPLGAQPTPRAGRRSKWIAAGGLLTLSGAVAWSLSLHGPAPRVERVSPPLPAVTLATALPEPAPVSPLPPVADEEPLSVQALPILADTAKPVATASASPPRTAKHKTARPRAAAAPAPQPAPAAVLKPKRKVVDDGF